MSTKKNEVAKVAKGITDHVLTRVNEFKATGQLKIPQDYSPENALKSAYLILNETKNTAGKTPMEACTTDSIASALLKMVVWGLSPMKNQCHFIMYGDKLECQIDYTGNIALAKRWGKMKDINAHAVFEGDEFEYETDPETGQVNILKHKGSLASQEKQKIVGAYAVVTMEDGTTFAEVMAMSQIKAAWNQGAMKGNSPAHKNFPDQMAIKTVISRACKLLIRGSDDAILYSPKDEPVGNEIDDQVAQEIHDEANKEVIDFEEANVEIEEKETEEKPKSEETQTEVKF